jgi:muramoyltetrapeptide carboxypeptidase
MTALPDQTSVMGAAVNGTEMDAANLNSADSMTPRRPRALPPGGTVIPFAPASPAEPERIQTGVSELKRLEFQIADAENFTNDGYFAGTIRNRCDQIMVALQREDVCALVGTRGGYGSNYLLDNFHLPAGTEPKIILGYSDLTSLQIFLWQRYRWVTLYGPMLAAGFDAGAGVAKGYDRKSLLSALQKTDGGWNLSLNAETMTTGDARGRLMGGCLTLVETAIGTPWDLQTDDAILVLEDRGMKPWQVDRALMHLKQAGKFKNVRGILLGDFPECESHVAGSATVRDVCRRILTPIGVPVVYGAPIGHTLRPMLTIPLGVMGNLSAEGAGTLEILEPAVAQ